MSRKHTFLLILGLALLLLAAAGGTAQAQDPVTDKAKPVPPPAPVLNAQEQLGKYLFFDANLSEPPGQACAACHAPSVGYTGPDAAVNAGGAVYQGAVPGMFGDRKPPAASYGGHSPVLYFDGAKWVGGMFWDGRATGSRLGDPLAEQAQGPFLNPREQNLPNPEAVIARVQASAYAGLFAQLCTVPTEYYDCIGRAIAAYERSAEVSPYTSKYDYSLRGQAKLTGQERRGMELFFGQAQCANCHPAPDFTDFSYDNLGLPRNPANPAYGWKPEGQAWADPGLGGYLQAAGQPESVYGPEWGKHKVPTLRNVDLRADKKLVKAYGHNGYFKSLEDIVHFYNTRDVPGAGWPAPEAPVNVNTAELGNLGLNQGDEKALVAFLATLSDGYTPK